MTFIQRTLILILLFSTTHVFARMYQWVSPDTGTTQLSGKPPAWYRGDSGGPRVLVFDNGRLVDDTDITVSDDVRLELRQRAFILVEEDKQSAKEKMAKAQELKNKYVDEEAIDEDMTLAPMPVEEEASADEVVREVERLREEDGDRASEEAEMAARLREMINDWEQQQTDNARRQLQE